MKLRKEKEPDSSKDRMPKINRDTLHTLARINVQVYKLGKW
jgi:hypothetical protein